jgi:GTP cyclohydrolase IB
MRRLSDVQARHDPRGIELDQVGICDLRQPISVLELSGEWQPTVAKVSMSVNLPSKFKGTHMSRFVEVLGRHREVTAWSIPEILRDVQATLKATVATVEFHFPYFISRQAPVSGASAMMDYQCVLCGVAEGDEITTVIGADVPVTSVCPCSKEISERGAHNQRGVMCMRVRPFPSVHPADVVWIEELVTIAEGSGSCPVYPLLKRPDERYVTMYAYDHPVFVEDMVREAAVQLKADERVQWFRVRATNAESIHHHSAFASVEWDRDA